MHHCQQKSGRLQPSHIRETCSPEPSGGAARRFTPVTGGRSTEGGTLAADAMPEPQRQKPVATLRWTDPGRGPDPALDLPQIVHAAPA